MKIRRHKELEVYQIAFEAAMRIYGIRFKSCGERIK